MTELRNRYLRRDAGAGLRRCSRHDSRIQHPGRLRTRHRHGGWRSLPAPARAMDGRHVDGLVPRRQPAPLQRLRRGRPDESLCELVAVGLLQLYRPLLRHRHDHGGEPSSAWEHACIQRFGRAIAHGTGFEDTVLAAANLGDHADTVAAMAGQPAGAFYDASAIPARWLERLAMKQEIERLALALVDSAISRSRTAS